MKDKFKTIWAHMRASEYGPEPLVLSLEEDEIVVQTISMNDPNAGCQVGLYVEGSGKTLDAALDDFSKNLDTWLMEENE